MEEAEYEELTADSKKTKVLAKKSVIALEEVPSQYSLKYKLPDGTYLTYDEYLLWMGNTLLDIKRALG